MKHQIQVALQTVIIKRMLSEKNFDQFIEDYNKTRFGNRRGREVTPLDRKIYADYKTGLMNGELMKKYKKSYSSILSSIVIAGRE